MHETKNPLQISELNSKVYMSVMLTEPCQQLMISWQLSVRKKKS